MIGGASLRRGLIALWCLVAVGCAEVTNEPTADAITTAEPAAAATTPSAADDAATPEPEPAFSAPVAELPGGTENPIDEPLVAAELEPAPPSAPTVDVPPGATDLTGVAPSAPATQDSEAAPDLIVPSAALPTDAETLDFSSLVARLRKTKAISLLTKVAVKNESEDLLEDFRAYHTQDGIASLADLRRSYDLLFHKLYSLLEDADPSLARDIDRSRAAIWELLADPRKFSASHLMAGA
jgi:hypothetical protein